VYSRSFSRNSQWTEFEIHCYHVFCRTNANGGSPEVNLSLSFEDDNTDKLTSCIFVTLINIESFSLSFCFGILRRTRQITIHAIEVQIRGEVLCS